MDCPTCSSEVLDSARFCQSCGTELHRECSNCSASLETDAAFCTHCGTPVASTAPSAPTTARVPVVGDRASGRTLAIVGLILVAVIVAWTAFGRESGPPDPLQAKSCTELADIWVEVGQLMLDDIGDAPSDDYWDVVDFAAAKYEREGQAFELQQDHLGCSYEQMDFLMCERIGLLEPRGPAGRRFVAEAC